MRDYMYEKEKKEAAERTAQARSTVSGVSMADVLMRGKSDGASSGKDSKDAEMDEEEMRQHKYRKLLASHRMKMAVR